MTEELLILFARGGAMMYPLLLCSLLVVTFAIERALQLNSGRLFTKATLEAWKTRLSSGSMEPPASSSAALLDQMLGPIQGYFPLPIARFEERLSDLSRKARNRLERGLVFLDLIGGVAPLFGLLGTALGMIDVFSKLSSSGQAKIESLSGGISEALFTTVAGLAIGIPALIAANLYARHIENQLLKVEDEINGLLDQFYDKMVEHENR